MSVAGRYGVVRSRLSLWLLSAGLIVAGLIVAWGMALTARAAEPAAKAAKSVQIVPPGAKWELLFTRDAPITGGLTEGPAAAPDGSIYFTDIPLGTDRGMILRYDPKSGQTSVFTDQSFKANGLAFDEQGRLLACEGSDLGGRAVAAWDVATVTRTVLADSYQGKKFNAPNDLVLDQAGRIYFTDPRYLGDEPRELEHRAVYRLDPDGKVSEVTHEVEKPNGIALSPDDRTLYVVDHNNGSDKIDPTAPPPAKGAMKIYAYPLSAAGKVNGPRRTLVDFGDEDGCDGMTVDEHGNIYLTARAASRPGLMVVDPEGKEVAFVSTRELGTGDEKAPGGAPSNCEFGRGAEAHVLYVTVDKSLYRIALGVRGLGR